MTSMDFLCGEEPEVPGGETEECCVTFGLPSGKDNAAPRGILTSHLGSDVGEAGRVLGGVWTGSQGEIRMSTLDRD